MEEGIIRRLREEPLEGQRLGEQQSLEVKGRENSRRAAYSTTEPLHPLNVAVRRTLVTLARVGSGG